MLTQQKTECKLWRIYGTAALQKKRLWIYVLPMDTYKSTHNTKYSGDPHDSRYVGFFWFLGAFALNEDWNLTSDEQIW